MTALQQLREKIDSIDDQIIDLLAQRMVVVDDIGEYKKFHALSPLDTRRWKELLQHHVVMAEQKGLSPVFITDLRERIHQESLSRYI